MRGQHRHKDQGVLGPLVHPQGFQHDLDADGRRGHHMADHRHLRCCQTHGLGCIDHDGRTCLRPDGHIDRMVATVIEPPLTKPRDQFGGLVAPRQVGAPIAGQHPIEDAQVIGHRLSQSRICGRAQPQRTARRFLRTQPVDEGLGVRQGGAVQGNTTGNLGLQVRLAPQQPHRCDEHIQGVLLDEQQEGLQQQITVDQRSVEVHTQRNGLGHGTHTLNQVLPRRAQTHSQPITTASHKVNKRHTRVNKMAWGMV
jgi:hypothetical protein